ncbi:hypothetical protein P3G55_14255 [Leptospira sp. 96542]|nr:hypothetical protein [Leptospira sp. 96542]
MQTERESTLSQKEKLFILTKFVEDHPEAEIQDFYKWLYYGEFGVEESSALISGKKSVPELHVVLEEIKREEAGGVISDLVWEPTGLSARFVKVYVTKYYQMDCPVKRLVNLLERSPAFRGARMTFKLDWNLLKETVLELKPELSRRDFINFEERINFHQLPALPFTDGFKEKNPFYYRVVSQKLFFDYFPEFEDESVFHPFSGNKPLIG